MKNDDYYKKKLQKIDVFYKYGKIQRCDIKVIIKVF